MENAKSKGLSSVIFIPLLFFIFIRPFLSGLTYPSLEIYYQNSIIFLGIISLLFDVRGPHVRGRASNMRYLLPISLLLLAHIISTLSSINIQNSINETIKFIGYLSIFFVVSQADLRQRKSLVKTQKEYNENISNARKFKKDEDLEKALNSIKSAVAVCYVKHSFMD